LKPLANAFANSAGYRQIGLKYDDILIEEREDVKKVSWRVFEILQGGLSSTMSVPRTGL